VSLALVAPAEIACAQGRHSVTNMGPVPVRALPVCMATPLPSSICFPSALCACLRFPPPFPFLSSHPAHGPSAPLGCFSVALGPPPVPCTPPNLRTNPGTLGTIPTTLGTIPITLVVAPRVLRGGPQGTVDGLQGTGGGSWGTLRHLLRFNKNNPNKNQN